MKSLDYVVHKSIKHQLSALIKLLFNYDKDSFLYTKQIQFSVCGSVVGYFIVYSCSHCFWDSAFGPCFVI